MIRKASRPSLIIYFSRPMRNLVNRFSMALFFLLAVFAIFVTQTDNNLAYNIRTKVADIVSPVTKSVSVPVNFVTGVDDSLGSYFFVRSKNHELLEENRSLRRQLMHLSGVQYENKRLQGLLNYVKTLQYKYISTSIVGSTDGPFLRSILIDAGKKDNVKKGQAVVNKDGLVGRITEVGEKSSRVLLLTDINSRIPVVASSSRERIIMSGNNNSTPRLVYVSADSNIAEGEVLITSGDGEMFPPGLQVGVAHKLKDKSYIVSPFVEWHNLEKLSVLDY